MKKTLSLIALTAMSVPAMAADDYGFYGSLGGGMYRFKADGFNENAPTAMLVGGYSFGPTVAVEGAYTRLFNSTDRIEGIDVTLSGNVWDLSTKLSYPIGERVRPFARIGWSYTDLNARASIVGISGSTVSENDYEDAFSWGVGSGVKLTRRMELNGEYQRVLINSGDLDRLSLNLNYRFGS